MPKACRSSAANLLYYLCFLCKVFNDMGMALIRWVMMIRVAALHTRYHTQENLIN